MEKPKLMMFEKNSEDHVLLWAELWPAEDEDDGYIEISVGENGSTMYSQHLDIDALGAMLLVFKGKSLEADCTDSGVEGDNGFLTLRREFTPASRYVITMRDMKTDKEKSLRLTDAQAAGLCAAIEGALIYVAFGNPNQY